MPKQSTRGIYLPYPTSKPKVSGVRRAAIVLQVLSGELGDTYLYYSKSDDNWFSASGIRITKRVRGFYELSA